ncbi:receptor activity-modifying protein 1-like [Periophthalmus magnuspinnatus]|uniref:receptor activity-modifying protein 1-like n=1 Tax=Periophthalmus magnuspinnatus TaxID=409849 RepID=UPI00145B50FB|nr:receptor activity-modifying protein 1-like [Periophthalmus magnuspinnatus]
MARHGAARHGAARGLGALLGLLFVLSGPVRACGPEYLEAVDQFCLSRFSLDMAQLDQSQWCSWDDTLESYGELTNCSFVVALKLGCYWPNREVDTFFVSVHRKYFSDCALIGRLLRDPPTQVSGPFILGPVLVTLLMTALVVWRSKRSEGIV